MGLLYVDINLDALHDLTKIQEASERAVNDASRDLSAMLHAKVVELANQKLHSRREMFIDNLSWFQVSQNVYVVQLAATARWIDDGRPASSMLDSLLNSPKAKQGKNGKYIVVPFEHGPGKGPTNSTPAQQDLVSTLKAEMKKRGVPFGKTERGQDGKPLLGKLHGFKFDMNTPVKTQEGPGQGWGAIGQPRQGPTGIPFLQGVNVYQNMAKDKQGKNYVKRSVMTFRVASEAHRSQGRWEHPGLPAMNIFEDAMKWAQDTWDKEMAPMIMDKLVMELS